MTERIPDPAYDEPAGEVGDQASHLQPIDEQEAIRAALAGHVHGTDALQDTGADVKPLEAIDPLDQDSDDASDDPVHGRGTQQGSG